MWYTKENDNWELCKEKSQMNDKKILSGTILYELDIFDKSGILKVGRLNSLLREFLKDVENFSKTKQILKVLKKHNGMLTVLVDETIRQYMSKLENVMEFVEKVEKNPDYKMINFEVASKEIKKTRFYFSFENCKPGLYEVNRVKNNPIFSNFEKDFKDADVRLKNKLLAAGFEAKMKTFRPERFRVVENAVVHTFSKDVTTISFEEKGIRCIDENFRGRTMVKFNAMPIVPKKTIEIAIFLPLQSAINNYYHNLSETVFGLKLIEMFPADAPIIYRKSQRFEIVPFYAEKLGIDLKRLVSIEELEGTVVKKAVLFHKDGFFWTKEHYDFFGKFVNPKPMPFRKVYISRKHSKRALTNEDEVEQHLEAQDFDIIYAENLTLEEQIKLFSETDILVSGHGAGLANILFMQPGTKLLEIFHETFLKSDYYQRSVHNQMSYQLAITDKRGYLDVNELLAKINLLLAANK